MDWIEHLIGISPDHGDGSVETMIATAIIVVLVAALLVVYRVRRGIHRRAPG